MTDFTPGPWRVVVPQADGYWGIVAEDGYPVVVITTVREPAMANTRLIAAAPEMHELLRDLKKGWHTLPRGQFADRIVALLAKVEGR